MTMDRRRAAGPEQADTAVQDGPSPGGVSLYDRIEALAHTAAGTRILRLQQVHELADTYGPFVAPERTESLDVDSEGKRSNTVTSLGKRSASIRYVELAALGADVVPARYLPNLGTIGILGQIKLLRSTVAVVGLGGLGGYVVEALARMGVGHLVLIDGDVFEQANLNRQLLCTEDKLGVEKARAACARVSEINAAVETICHVQVLTRENLHRLLQEVAVVVDALDRLPTRLMLQEGAQALGIPMVHGSIAGFLGQVSTVFPGDPGLRGLYGDVDQLPEQGLETQLGTPAPTPMVVAAWEALEVVKILTGRGQPLRDRLLVIDMESATSQILQLG
jgi:molybdopterin/thiamine biosynthesis adenylyltransferase